MGFITAERMNSLKAEVKAECQRRNASGSVAAYGGSEYDYTVVPAKGVIISAEHFDKNAIPLNAINSGKQAKTSAAGTVINDSEITAMEAFATTLKARIKTDAGGTDCKAGCTGLCYGCQGTCTGCTGCWDACSGCGSGCAFSCSGGCTNACSGCGSGCAFTCTGGCSSCSGTCTGSCTSCTGSCTGCGGDCTYGCVGCLVCSNSCLGACTGGCGGQCSMGCTNASWL